MVTSSTESTTHLSNSSKEEQPMRERQLGRQLGAALAAEHLRVSGKAWAQHNYLLVRAARIWEVQGVWQVDADADVALFVQGYVDAYKACCR